MEFVNVIVDISHEKVDRVFQYRIPERLKNSLKVGMQVEIPFGRGNRLTRGYAVGFAQEPDYPPEKIKELFGIVEGSVRAESQLIALAAWMKERYGSTMNHALKTVLPVKQKTKQKQKKKLETLQKETKAAKTIALTVQDIETMGKKATFGNNITLTPDECDTLKRYAVNGVIANADNKRLKEKLASAEKTVSIWKQRYEAVNEKYMELKQKAQPFLDALEIASEKVRAFINSVLIRGKETQEHEHPARKRGQDMEL